MGIAPHIAETIIKEHKFRPITGNVMLLGRQTMLFSPSDAVAMLRNAGVKPGPIASDETALDTRTLAAQGHHYITDAAFFRLLGITKITALDHTDYEGAEIIHDLNRPIPDRLEGCADFILDGSTLDNLFAPSIALQSIARMLNPGGRLLSINMGSAHYSPYLVFTPWWFLDYFALNEFADCRAYYILYRRSGMRAIAADPFANVGETIPSSNVVGVLVFAEKGERSTWDRMPDQRHYASESMKEVYRRAAERFTATSRPHLVRTHRSHHPLWWLAARRIWRLRRYISRR